MSRTDATTQRELATSEPHEPWFAQEADRVVAAVDSDAERGLNRAEAATRLPRHGPNQIASEKPPSLWAVARQQVRDPMNIMLVAVVAVSLLIGELSTAIIVGLLVALNIVLGTRQELTARASIDALSKMQVPQAKVLRDGELALVPASSWSRATSCSSKPATSSRSTGGSSDRRRWRSRRPRSPGTALPWPRPRARFPPVMWRWVTGRTCFSEHLGDQPWSSSCPR